MAKKSEEIGFGHEQNVAEQFNKFSPVYDNDYRNYDADLELIVDLAEDCSGPVLELGCGTGRVMLPLCQRGLSGTGIDISPALLSVAQAKLDAAGYGKQMSLITGDIRDFALSTQDFAFAYCVSNTIMHCTSQGEQIRVMQNAFSHLRPGGLFLVDIFNPDLVALAEVAGLQELADSWEDAEKNQVIKWSIRSVDVATQCQDTLFIYETVSPLGEVTKRICPFTLRFIWPSEGSLMLEKAGFDVVSVWGDFDGEPYHSGSERIIYLARKA